MPLEQQKKISVDKTLIKGLDIIESLSNSKNARGVSDIAKELSLTKSNVHRILQTLIGAGYVQKENDTDRYTLTSKLWRLSRYSSRFPSLREHLRPILLDAVEEIGETILFAALEGDTLIVVDQVETNSAVRAYMSLGQAFKLDEVLLEGKGLTALQRVALAYCEDQYWRGGANSQVDNGSLREIASNGFAVSRGEWISDVTAVNVPVFDNGRLLGVLCCFGPSVRFNEWKVASLPGILTEVARDIQARLS